MNHTKAFVELDKQNHDRTSFDCGEAELNNFIKQFAAKHMHANISKTMVLPTVKPLPSGKRGLCAFYTVTPSAIQRETLPANMAKKLPHYPVPVFLIAQLAVDKSCQGKGLGKITLTKALEYLFEVNKHMKAYAVVVDCLNSSAQQFYLQFGFQTLNHHNNRTRMFLPMKTVVHLFK